MNRTTLPAPPDPSSTVYANNPMAWMKAMYSWAAQVKSKVEIDSNANTTPIGPFVVGTYTQVSTVTGTDALSNFVATLVTGMNGKGITSPSIQRTTT